MRITIIGHSGGGKSRLATRISKKFNIPHLHLDTFWFEAKGHHTKGDVAREADRPRVEKYVEEKVQHFIAQDSWVSDGWFGHVQPTIAARADQIVFIDLSLLRRLWNQLYRAVFGKRRHPDITFFDDIKFISQIVGRTRRQDQRLRAFVAANKEKVVTLHNYHEVEEYLKDLK